jgi:hypothetical protein
LMTRFVGDDGRPREERINPRCKNGSRRSVRADDIYFTDLSPL